MTVAESRSIITQISRIWMLGPFLKALRKREHEPVLLDHLQQCVQQLFDDPRHPGLNLETLNHTGKHAILSARMSKSCRVILAVMGATEVGLLYFDSNHDEAYHWVDRNRSRLPMMLSRENELLRGSSVTNHLGRPPVIHSDEDSPIVLRSAEQFREMIEGGIARYLTYLDEEQRWLVSLRTSGLLLVKGGAGTGKTAVAIHRVKALADQPTLPGAGPERVLYLCYNALLAKVVSQLLESLYGGAIPPTVEVKTFHTWCYDFLREHEGRAPTVDEDRCRQGVYKAFGRLSPEQRSALSGLGGRFVDEEIEQVIKHNGITERDQYLLFERRGRGAGIKRAGREMIWGAHERAREEEEKAGVCRYCDLPLRALEALRTMEAPPQYRAVVIDEGQDCSPVMIRLARQLLSDAKGPLMVFADPAQGIYECGFQWTQKELRPAGGNVRWLRKTYRTTIEIFSLSRKLVDDSEDLQEDLAKVEPPTRRGPRPVHVVAGDKEELQSEIIRRIGEETAARPANQIGVLGANWETLRELGAELRNRDIPVSPAQRGALRLDEPTVKLLTMQGAKGLDFPAVFVIGPHRNDLGGKRCANEPETRRTVYVALTRSSEKLTVGITDGHHHPLIRDA